MAASDGWLVSLKPLSPPRLSPAGTPRRSREDELVALWVEHVSPEAGGDGDYEDFFEQAVRLEAALEAFGPENVWVWVMRPAPEPGARNAATGEWQPLSLLEGLPGYGHQPGRAGHRGSQLEQERLADAYPAYAAFHRNAGRRVRLAGVNASPADYRDVVLELAAEGVERFFLKFTAAKAGAFALDLPAGASRDDVLHAVPEEYCWTMVRLEEDPGTLTVQEHVPMHFEYRLFVVDGKPVTGAGCVEEFTPLDNIGQAFDIRVRRERQTFSPVEDRPDVVDRLVAFGARVAAELAEEVPALRQYVLDVAVGPDGEPLVVELNGLLNAGLYATDPRLVTQAMTAAPSTSCGGGAGRQPLP